MLFITDVHPAQVPLIVKLIAFCSSPSSPHSFSIFLYHSLSLILSSVVLSRFPSNILPLYFSLIPSHSFSFCSSLSFLSFILPVDLSHFFTIISLSLSFPQCSSLSHTSHYFSPCSSLSFPFAYTLSAIISVCLSLLLSDSLSLCSSSSFPITHSLYFSHTPSLILPVVLSHFVSFIFSLYFSFIPPLYTPSFSLILLIHTLSLCSSLSLILSLPP
ncbi:unnamed protein product [Acanthosepion pharaonis]|uniref:Uncharacterized protein n=1 Tax=Acanthosepion pharaonis TaxID=158019 RepID=A0A812DZ79_ACAPH|nr:unnamed protein product [Sepia pharaonis]